MNGEALAYLVDTCHARIEERVASLQTETVSSKIAVMQGNIKGYTFLLSLLKEEFELDDDFVKNTNSIPVDPNKMESVALTDLCFDFETMVADERWAMIINRLTRDEIEMGSLLLHEAKNARTMQVCQGKLEGQTCTQALFNSIQDAKKRQDAREVEARKNPSLPFDGVDIPEIDIEDMP